MPLGRPRSPLRTQHSHTGVELGGVILTDTDLARIGRLARWYCLSAAHLARVESSPTIWHPALAAPEQETAFANRVLGIRRRLARLATVAENGTHIGAPVGKAMLGNLEVAWFCTSYGGTAAQAPWRLSANISPLLAHHAFAAADVGFQLESLRIPTGPQDGFIVLAEREIRTKVDQYGDDVIKEIESPFRGANSVINKNPDLAVMHANRTTYIAVEVERDRTRPLRSYREKLAAYEANPAVLAVWYLCDHPTVARRVARAAGQVFGDNSGFPLRIRTLTHHPLFVEIPDLGRDANLLADLARLG